MKKVISLILVLMLVMTSVVWAGELVGDQPTGDAAVSEGGQSEDNEAVSEGGQSEDNAAVSEGGQSEDNAAVSEGGQSEDNAAVSEGGQSDDNAAISEGMATGEIYDICILYTNDIHGGIEDNIGLAGLAAYKNDMLGITPFVTLVDCGDSVQGSMLSAMSQGVAIISAMNQVGYDYRIFGNHEFDYKLSGVKALVDESDATYLNCNISYFGSGEDVFENTVPYAIETYADTKVAFVGVTTPNTISSSTPAYFKEDGEFVCDFCGGNDGQDLYDRIQETVDECLEAGADYVVLMAHLGIDEIDTPFTSKDVIANTTGIDVVLDAHSHSVIDGITVENKNGEDVILASTGTKMANIGMLIIGGNGQIEAHNISDYENKDEDIAAWIENTMAVYEGFAGQTLFTIDKTLPITDENGARMVRSREMPIGDFCADAYRIVMGAELGIINGGGVRDALNEGDISMMNIISLNPFGNMICVIEVTGQQIADILEYSYRYVEEEYVADGAPLGEYGSFMQLSGIKCKINLSVEPTVEVDDNDMFLDITGDRRVCDIMVLDGDEYVPIDPEKTYTLAINDYIAKNGGCGMEQYLAYNKIIVDSAATDYEVLISYATDILGGDLSQYYEDDDRIVLVK